MQPSNLKIFTEPSERLRKSSELIGYACALMAKVASHAAFPVGRLYQFLRPAIRLGKVNFFFDSDGEVVGYVVWAMLADDVENRFIRNPNFELHPSEWDEGDSLWIMDFVIVNGGLQYALEYMRDVLFKERDRVRYRRVKRGKVYVKEISRNAKLTFFAMALAGGSRAIESPISGA